jgi:hypothetical protein
MTVRQPYSAGVVLDGVDSVGGIDGELPGSGFAMAVASIRGSLATAPGVLLGWASPGWASPGWVDVGPVAIVGAFRGETGCATASLRLGLAWPVTPSTVTVVSTVQPLSAYE